VRRITGTQYSMLGASPTTISETGVCQPLHNNIVWINLVQFWYNNYGQSLFCIPKTCRRNLYRCNICVKQEAFSADFLGVCHRFSQVNIIVSQSIEYIFIEWILIQQQTDSKLYEYWNVGIMKICCAVSVTMSTVVAYYFYLRDFSQSVSQFIKMA